MIPGNRMDTTNCAVVAIRLEPQLLETKLDTRDFSAVTGWIEQDRDVPIGYRDGEFSTLKFVTKRERLTPSD